MSFLHSVPPLTEVIDHEEFDHDGESFAAELARWPSGDYSVTLYRDGEEVYGADFLEEQEARDMFFSVTVYPHDYL